MILSTYLYGFNQLWDKSRGEIWKDLGKMEVVAKVLKGLGLSFSKASEMGLLTPCRGTANVL
ncbi:hypothetical protein B4Q04_21580 [Zobellia sp. OII3]|nr:hypothetical protein B4Q04_21580 [Zobellia sp. OII3]